MSRQDYQAAQTFRILETVIPGVSKLISAKNMNQPLSDDYWPKRRALLRQQSLQINRMYAEAAGQLVLPIFGDPEAEKRTVVAEAASLVTSKALHLADQPRRA